MKQMIALFLSCLIMGTSGCSPWNLDRSNDYPVGSDRYVEEKARAEAVHSQQEQLIKGTAIDLETTRAVEEAVERMRAEDSTAAK